MMIASLRAENRACAGVAVSSSMIERPLAPCDAACPAMAKTRGAMRPPAKPIAAAPAITAGNGTAPAKSATNAAAAIAHRIGWRSVREPMRHAAASTIATTAGFTP